MLAPTHRHDLRSTLRVARRAGFALTVALAATTAACGHTRATADIGVDVTYALEPFRLLPYSADAYCAERHVAASVAETSAIGPRAVLAMPPAERAHRAQVVMDASCALVAGLRARLETARAQEDSATFSCVRADWARAEVTVWSTREHLEALRALSDGSADDDNGVAAEESGILEMLYLRSREIAAQAGECTGQTIVRETRPLGAGARGATTGPEGRVPGGA